MVIGSPSPAIRQWLRDNGFDVGAKGSISTEFYDVYTAVTAGHAVASKAIAYVYRVRSWIVSQGTDLTRSTPMTRHHFAKFDKAHPDHSFNTEDSAVLSRDAEIEACDVVSAYPAESLMDAEAHTIHAREYSGATYVTNQMNLTYLTLFRTAMEEAISVSWTAVKTNGSPTDQTYEVLSEMDDIVKMAQVFLSDLIKTFHAEEVPSIPPAVSKLFRTATYGKAEYDKTDFNRLLRDAAIDSVKMMRTPGENPNHPMLGTEFEGVTLEFDSPHVFNKCIREGEVGTIEANGIEGITDREILLIHWTGRTEDVHEWVYPENLVIYPDVE